MEVGYRLHVLLTLELSLTLATSHNDTCSGGDGLFTVPGEKNENRSNHSGGVAARSCSAPTTESTALSLLVGGHQEGVVVNGSEDIFVSIKTTQKYHDTRLPPILLTWLQTIHPWQVHLVTDVGVNDKALLMARQEGFGVTNSSCPANHYRKSLCCKSGVEYEQYYREREKNTRWFCHFDDDVYVNIRELVALLRNYAPSIEPVYLGRWPLSRETMQAQEQRLSVTFPHYKRTNFRYATGAAYCISSFLMDKMEPYCRGTLLEENCESMGYPDDVLIGAVVGAVLGFKLTNQPTMNSNLNGQRKISGDMLKHQITISYGEFKFSNRAPVKNIVIVPDAAFSEEKDPTREGEPGLVILQHTLTATLADVDDLL